MLIYPVVKLNKQYVHLIYLDCLTLFKRIKQIGFPLDAIKQLDYCLFPNNGDELNKQGL